MGSRGVLRTVEGGVGFWCPGCEGMHVVNGGWAFNGDYDRPTFSPSVLIMTGHHLPTHRRGQRCWCTYAAEHPNDPAPFKCERCHSFVVDGRIQFLTDSTHALAGQTVELRARGDT